MRTQSTSPRIHQVSFDIAPTLNGHFAVTAMDAGSGTVIGMRILPPGPDGRPPQLTIGDMTEMMGGAYRIGCVEFDLACRSTATQTRRTSRLISRQRRRGSRAALRQALA